MPFLPISCAGIANHPTHSHTAGNQEKQVPANAALRLFPGYQRRAVLLGQHRGKRRRQHKPNYYLLRGGWADDAALRDKRRSKPVACQAIASNSAPKKQHHNLGKVVADDAAHWQNAKQGVYHNRHKGRHRRANRHGDPPKAHPNHSAHGHSRPQLKQAGRQQRHHQRKQQRPQGNIKPLGPAQRFILHKQYPLAKFSIIVYGIL